MFRRLREESYCHGASLLVASFASHYNSTGAYKMPEFWNKSTASGVQGILAPSQTSFTPFLMSIFASSSLSSFSHAVGKAASQGINQDFLPSWNSADFYFLTYSLKLPRLTNTKFLRKESFSSSRPSLS